MVKNGFSKISEKWTYQKRLLDLQIKIRTRTGINPLEGTFFQHNRLFSDINDISSLTLTSTSGSSKGQIPSLPPRPKKRKAKNQIFPSHTVNDWERFSTITIANAAKEESFV